MKSLIYFIATLFTTYCYAGDTDEVIDLTIIVKNEAVPVISLKLNSKEKGYEVVAEKIMDDLTLYNVYQSSKKVGWVRRSKLHNQYYLSYKFENIRVSLSNKSTKWSLVNLKDKTKERFLIKKNKP